MAEFGREDIPATDESSAPDQTQYIDRGMRVCQICRQIVMKDQMESHRQGHAPDKVQFSQLLFREGD